MPGAFHEFEQAGWERAAGFYGDAFGALTAQTAQPLLDAVGAASGTRMLDVATGPGFIAAAAAKRGASVVGLDFSAAMLAEAARLHPAIAFREGDAEALRVRGRQLRCSGDELRAAAPRPPRGGARRGASRAAAGGRYAFTVWAAPERAVAFGMTLRAIEQFGIANVPLPEGPPFFRFSDAAETARTLASLGFTGSGGSRAAAHLAGRFSRRGVRRDVARRRPHRCRAPRADARGARRDPRRASAEVSRRYAARRRLRDTDAGSARFGMPQTVDQISMTSNRSAARSRARVVSSMPAASSTASVSAPSDGGASDRVEPSRAARSRADPPRLLPARRPSGQAHVRVGEPCQPFVTRARAAHHARARSSIARGRPARPTRSQKPVQNFGFQRAQCQPLAVRRLVDVVARAARDRRCPETSPTRRAAS